MEIAPQEPADYISRLREARNSTAVLKLRLVELKGRIPGSVAVLAFEGDDDKLIYSQWISRVTPDLLYEPFPCRGKRQVLALKEVVLRDRGGSGGNVFFFVDRDFDDLAGHEPHERLFMTERYSVENYLVSEDVLDVLLTNVFHCHGHPEIRGRITRVFTATYDQFLEHMTDTNFRLFVAKQLGLLPTQPVSSGWAKLVPFDLERCRSVDGLPNALVVLPRDLTQAEIDAHSAGFDSLPRRDRHRGKFALAFFQRWLHLLADEYKNPTLGLFQGIEGKSNARVSELVISVFASKSRIPERLCEFLGMISCSAVSLGAQSEASAS